MDSDSIIEHSNKRKSRLSLFIPPNLSNVEIKENNSVEIDYIHKLKSEEKGWKQIYAECKKTRLNLLEELRHVKSQPIDYNTFHEEDIKFLNAKPDLKEFIKLSKDLQNIVQIANLRNEDICKQITCLLQQVEEYTTVFETEVSHKI